MVTLTGKSVCGGIAFGKIYIYSRKEKKIKRVHVESAENEITRFEAAIAEAKDELEHLYEESVSKVGKENAMIFRIHQMMLEDDDFIEAIKNIIADQTINAEVAIAQTCDNFVDMFENMADSYMRERSADVKDVSERLIRILSGASGNIFDVDEPVILVADDLSPSETVQFDKSELLAFVTEGGSPSSHTAILARMLNIPALICTKNILDEAFNGKNAIVDGFGGNIYIEPDTKTIKTMQDKAKNAQLQHELLQKLKGVDSVSKDGKKTGIFANIGNVSDIYSVLNNDAEGIGLFRSEFIYLESDKFPTEDEQFAVYKDVLSKMSGKKVVIRTLDIGADKQVDYLDMPHEENPALGMRAIRLCLTRSEIFKTQLRALYRATVFGTLAIMFPMIVSEWEIVKVLEIINEVKSELDNDGIPYSDNIELGCMIETPASAIVSDTLAKYMDFFSIGTNDLIQYTLAADRQNGALSDFCDSKHPAVMRLIEMTVDNAHKHGLWVGICGELASDITLTTAFLAMGVDELSVTPSMVLPIRHAVIESDTSDFEKFW